MEQKDGEVELKTGPEQQERSKRKRGRLEVEKCAGTRENVNVPGNQRFDVRHDDDSRGSEREKEKPTKNVRRHVKIVRNHC